MQPSSQTKLIPIKVNHELNFVSSAIRYHTIGLLHSGQKVVFEDDKRHDFSLAHYFVLISTVS